jgi:hypothetical protein
VAIDIPQDVLGILATEDRIEEDTVELAVDAARGIDVAGVGRVDRVGDGEVERDTQLERGIARAELVDDEAVPEQQVVGRGESGADVLPSRRMFAADVAEERWPRTRRNDRRCRGWPSRPSPRAPAAGPSGRGSATA